MRRIFNSTGFDTFDSEFLFVCMSAQVACSYDPIYWQKFTHWENPCLRFPDLSDFCGFLIAAALD